MTTSIFYYPVLKWKAGERTALKELYDHQKQVIIPIIEVINQVSASDFVDELASFPGPVVVDTIHLDDDNELLIEILNQAHRKGKQLIPLLYVSNIGAPSIRTFSKTNIVAIAIPIAEDIEGPDQQEIFRRISASFKDSRVDLILDLGIMTQRADANTGYALLKFFLKCFGSELSRFRRIIIRSSSFPTDIGSVQSGSSDSFPRYDMQIFEKLMTDNKHLPFLKNIAFSDYGVTKFTDSEIDFSKVGGRILPKVKYTTKESYLVYKGKRDWDKGDWIVSARDMAKTVVASKNFYGKDFSYGDNEIYNISASSTRLGSNQDWVAYCANHHIAVVVDELSNLAESLGLS